MELLRHFALRHLLIALSGCAAEFPSEEARDEMIPQGSGAFGPNTHEGQPGIDFGSIRYAGKRVIIWSDGVEGVPEYHSETVKCHLQDADDPTVSRQCQCEYPLSGRGTTTIADRTFRMADGNMFLVSLRGPEIRVLQLRRELPAVEIKHNTDNVSVLKQAMKHDSDFKEFFDRSISLPVNGK